PQDLLEAIRDLNRCLRWPSALQPADYGSHCHEDFGFDALQSPGTLGRICGLKGCADFVGEVSEALRHLPRVICESLGLVLCRRLFRLWRVLMLGCAASHCHCLR